MSKETLVFICGAFILLTPFLGFPREYKDWFLVGVGVVLMLVGYFLRRHAFLRSLENESGERKTDVFVENNASFSDQKHPQV